MAENGSAYLKTQILTARPEQLTLMLFDGAIRFAEKARGFIGERNFEGSFEALSRAEAIVMELLNGIHPEAAPEVCRQQAGLYIFVYSRLVEANMTRQVAPLDDALRVLRILRESWVMLMEKLLESAQNGVVATAAEPAPPCRFTAEIRTTQLT